MNNLRLVLVTFPTPEAARQIGTVLVEKQLAACVNLISAVESIYRWQGQVFAWVGWGNVASAGSLIKQGGKLFSGEADPWNIAFAAFPVLIGLLALVLAYGVFAGYKRETDPLTGVERVVFREEPAF